MSKCHISIAPDKGVKASSATAMPAAHISISHSYTCTNNSHKAFQLIAGQVPPRRASLLVL